MNRKDLTINIRGRLLDFDNPKVMAIVNVTPDSFFAGSRATDPSLLRKRILQVLEEGADIIDVGGCSTRPGALDISAAEEFERLKPALDLVRELAPEAVLSLDTWRAEVAEKAIDAWQVDILNDVSFGSREPELIDVVADKGVAYILTHSRGVPSTMQDLASYGDITAEVITELTKRVHDLRLKKIKDIIIDPGFGFAKTPEQSLRLLDEIGEFCRMGMPLLAGLSRKSMIWKTLGTSAEESYEGTIALNALALDRGADIVRVHDVKPAVETIRLLREMKGKVR